MEDSFRIGISSALPFSEAQYNGLMQIVDNMDYGYHELEVKFPNYAEYDDFMAVYLEWRDGRYRMELDFPMDDFGWKYPLVLAADLDGKRTAQLLRELLVDVSGTEGNELVLNCFRQVPAERYGERKPTVYERTYESEYGKENGNAGGTD